MVGWLVSWFVVGWLVRLVGWLGLGRLVGWLVVSAVGWFVLFICFICVSFVCSAHEPRQPMSSEEVCLERIGRRTSGSEMAEALSADGGTDLKAFLLESF